MSSDFLYDINLLRDYSSIFSRREVNKWIKNDFRTLDNLLDKYSVLEQSKSIKTYLDFVKHSYSVIEENYKNEYVYKNSFLNEWLIKELGQSDSIVFNEFRAGTSVCDLAMFNGVSKAFEIKTEFDSDKRLKSQINDYLKIFNKVYLIVPKNKVNFYLKYTEPVGLISYNGDLKNRFELIKEANFNMSLESQKIIEILHSEEYLSIVENYYGELPKMNSFNQYKICSKLISKIPLEELNSTVIDHIKKRKFHRSFSLRYFKEINQLCLALRLNKNQKYSLINNLKEPVK